MAAYDSVGIERVQAFLDEATAAVAVEDHATWYQVDVATFLEGTPIQHHEIDPCTGDALLFLRDSLLFCCPSAGILHHFPRHLIHCFIHDHRIEPHPSDPDLLLRCELFSVTPEQEQLCWVRECLEEHQIPATQRAVATWMRWLNGA